MSPVHWFAAPLLLASAAAVTTWSGRSRRARQRAVIGPPAGAGSIPDGPTWRSLVRHRLSGGIDTGAVSGEVWQGLRAPGWIVASPRRTTLGGAMLAGGVGAVTGGPVAGLAAAVYGGLAVRTALRQLNGRAGERERRRKLDSLGGLAADLRAGLPVHAALAPLTPLASPVAAGTAPTQTPSAAESPTAGPVAAGDDRIIVLTRAALRLAEQTGAPLADLIERIEADARMMDRGLAAAAAQAAGARATAWLLAGLPLGGIALGYGIGVDPLHVLLRTPIGAACAVGALMLQLAGLAWADRLSSGPARSI